MSKQTNAFQKLIHHIHSITENTNAKVTESAFLMEKNIAEPIAREIDILIEKEINGKIAKIAIECRDRFEKTISHGSTVSLENIRILMFTR